MNAHIDSFDRHVIMHNGKKFTQRGYLVSRIQSCDAATTYDSHYSKKPPVFWVLPRRP